ncbi:MAG TPA: hypothetical protein PKI99_07695, partial [Terrimesophilobacter sp.]|nr:hypothetical protein [Terrimesophilobacter sp.]
MTTTKLHDAEIPVTQYVRPDGRRREIGIVRPSEIAEMAQRCLAAGMRFEAEVLTTGHVSLTVVGKDDDGEEGDIAIRVVKNGPGVVAEAFDSLV